MPLDKKAYAINEIKLIVTVYVFFKNYYNVIGDLVREDCKSSFTIKLPS